LPYMEIADIVVNNNETFENGLGVLLGFIESKTKN
jgi:hypothetical protein